MSGNGFVEYAREITAWHLPDLDPADGDRTRQLAAAIRRAIEAGTLRQGRKLPGYTGLQRRYQVSASTVGNAMVELAAAGLVRRAPRGWFVCGTKREGRMTEMEAPAPVGELRAFVLTRLGRHEQDVADPAQYGSAIASATCGNLTGFVERAPAMVAAWQRLVAPHTTAGCAESACDGCGYQGPADDPVTDDIDQCPVLRTVARIYEGEQGWQQRWAK